MKRLEASSGKEEFLQILKQNWNVVVISEKEIDFFSQSPNRVFVLFVGGSKEGGGRIGAIGSRAVASVWKFIIEKGNIKKVINLEGEKARLFEVPHFVTRLPVRLPDGSETVVYGAIDFETVESYEKNANTS